MNGRPTQALLDFTNNEAQPVELALIGGALVNPQPLPESVHPSAAIVRNLTSTKYGVEIPAGGSQSMPYFFTTDMQPQDLRLQLVAVLMANKEVYQIQAYNETVSVVEPAMSFFDPQMYALLPHPFFPLSILSKRSIS